MVEPGVVDQFDLHSTLIYLFDVHLDQIDSLIFDKQVPHYRMAYSLHAM